MILSLLAPGSWADSAPVTGLASMKRSVFPSKTYFLMVVDQYLAAHIQRDDISLLLRIEGMRALDEVAIYHGIRRAMLRQAAERWDAGEVEVYGYKVGQLMGWHTVNNASERRIQNRLLVFRYALASHKAKRVLAPYVEQLAEAVLMSVQQGEGWRLSGKDCSSAVLAKLDYDLYQKLGQMAPTTPRVIDLALLYELLSPTQRCALETMLDQQTETVKEDEIRHDIAQAHTLPSSVNTALFSYANLRTPLFSLGSDQSK